MGAPQASDHSNGDWSPPVSNQACTARNGFQEGSDRLHRTEGVAFERNPCYRPHTPHTRSEAKPRRRDRTSRARIALVLSGNRAAFEAYPCCNKFELHDLGSASIWPWVITHASISGRNTHVPPMLMFTRGFTRGFDQHSHTLTGAHGPF